MSDVLIQKLIFTSLLLSFVFALGALICNDRRHYKLENLCIYSLGLTGIFILAAMLLRVWA